MAHTQPISVYIDTAQFHAGRPNAVVDRDESGNQRIRLHPAGVGGPYISITPDHWDILAAVVADARADGAS